MVFLVNSQYMYICLYIYIIFFNTRINLLIEINFINAIIEKVKIYLCFFQNGLLLDLNKSIFLIFLFERKH